jgi:bacteriocin-like protein
MANIEVTDRNSCDLGIMEEVEELTSEELLDKELTTEELQTIDGGLVGLAGGAAGSILDNTFNGEPINWRSAGAWALGGGIAGAWGGPASSGLAGTD